MQLVSVLPVKCMADPHQQPGTLCFQQFGQEGEFFVALETQTVMSRRIHIAHFPRMPWMLLNALVSHPIGSGDTSLRQRTSDQNGTAVSPRREFPLTGDPFVRPYVQVLRHLVLRQMPLKEGFYPAKLMRRRHSNDSLPSNFQKPTLVTSSCKSMTTSSTTGAQLDVQDTSAFSLHVKDRGIQQESSRFACLAAFTTVVCQI